MSEVSYASLKSKCLQNSNENTPLQRQRLPAETTNSQRIERNTLCGELEWSTMLVNRLCNNVNTGGGWVQNSNECLSKNKEKSAKDLSLSLSRSLVVKEEKTYYLLHAIAPYI